MLRRAFDNLIWEIRGAVSDLKTVLDEEVLGRKTSAGGGADPRILLDVLRLSAELLALQEIVLRCLGSPRCGDAVPHAGSPDPAGVRHSIAEIEDRLNAIDRRPELIPILDRAARFGDRLHHLANGIQTPGEDRRRQEPHRSGYRKIQTTTSLSAPQALS